MSSSPVPSAEFYLSLIGVSAIVGAGVSAIFNYFVTLRVSRKQSQIKMVEEKLDLYSYIIFHLDKMRFKGEAIKERKGDTSGDEVFAYSDKNNELEGVVSLINDKIKDRYYLFKQDILKEWIYVDTNFAHPSTKKRLPKLRQMIITYYNTQIIAEYQKLTGRKIDQQT